MNVLIFKHPFVPNEMSDKKKKQVDWDDMPGHINADSFTRITSVDCLFQIAELCNQFSQVKTMTKTRININLLIL